MTTHIPKKHDGWNTQAALAQAIKVFATANRKPTTPEAGVKPDA